MTTPRILLDEQGNKWELQNRGTIPICGDETKREVIFSLAPYIERKPLFTDLAGNPVCEGDETWVYQAEDNIYVDATAFPKMVYEAWDIFSPRFRYKSDCEKWVNSNVKRYTYEEALRLMLCTTDYASLDSFRQAVREIIKEKCLLPAY